MELMLGSRGYWDGEGVERWPQGFCVRGAGGPESDVWTARKGDTDRCHNEERAGTEGTPVLKLPPG